jgi:hypothetical protein
MDAAVARRVAAGGFLARRLVVFAFRVAIAQNLGPPDSSRQRSGMKTGGRFVLSTHPPGGLADSCKHTCLSQGNRSA